MTDKQQISSIPSSPPITEQISSPQQQINNSTTSSNSNTPSITNTTTTITTGNNTFESILESWKLFNIDRKKNEFGDNVTQIGALKEDCLKSRKVLAKQTQDFKKLMDDEKIKQFGSLLKLYQEEVDKLTKRSKFSETVFLGVYKDINEMSDPVPALSAALEEYSKVDTTGRLELENKKLLMQLSDFKKEFQEIQNQEVTIRRLEDKIKEYENRFESSTLEKVNARELELKNEYSEKLTIVKQREQSLTKQNDQLQLELTRLSISQNQIQNQLMDVKTKYEDELQSKQSEIEMLSTEFERVSSKLSTLQRENLSIREESVIEKNSLTPMVKRVAELELEMLQKETETSKLQDTIQDLKSQITIEHEQSLQFSRLYNVEKEKVEKLDKYIQNNPSPLEFENIKKELATLQAIIGQDEINNDKENNGGGKDGKDQSSGDKLLKEKNKQLENECTRLRLLSTNQEQDLIEKNLTIDELQKLRDDHLLLIERLEDDLNLQTNNNNGNGMNSGGNAGTLVYQQQQQQQNSLHSSQQLSLRDLSDITDLLPQQSSILTPSLMIQSPSSLSESGTGNGINRSLNESWSNSPNVSGQQPQQLAQTKDDKMMDIVIGQRDRFKSKISELESDKSKFEKQLDLQRQELASLKTDNIKLYEKIRFLQSYDKNKSGGSGSGIGSGNSNNNNINNNKRNNSAYEKSYDIERGLDIPSSSQGPETEEKYGKLYEESINPFLSFNKKEKYRRYKEMNTAERVILNGSRFFLSNKYSRLFLFIYSVFLHLMVFLTLYRLATITTEQHENFNQNFGGNGINHLTPAIPRDDQIVPDNPIIE